jgi:hypothetical protein
MLSFFFTKTIKPSALLLACTLSFSGCVSTSEIMQSWVGRSESDLVSRWGAPDSSTQTDDGKKVLTWKTLWNDDNNIYTCRKSFTIGVAGKVERWAYNGCPSYQLK